MIYLSHLIPDQEMSELFLTYPVGLETIEFSIASCLNHFTDTLHEYSRRIEQMNPAAVSVHGPFLDLNPASYDSIIRAATRERFEQAYAAARALNATKIIYHSCFIPQINYYEGWIEQAVPFWKKFLDDKPTDITICMENVFDGFPSYIKKVIQQVNHPLSVSVSISGTLTLFLTFLSHSGSTNSVPSSATFTSTTMTVQRTVILLLEMVQFHGIV